MLNLDKMKIENLHSWQVSPDKAREIQEELKAKVILRSAFSSMSQIRFVAGCDVAYDEEQGKAYGSAILLNFPEVKLLEKKGVMRESGRIFPYIPGLLAFREAPILIEALKKLRRLPDVVICDGQGIAHPQRFGLASHIGLLTGLPTIGCAKSVLYGYYEEPVNLSGAYTFLKDDRGELIGAVLRAKKNVKPIYVSQGYKIDLDQALDIIIACCLGGRIPEPLRLAHLEALRSLKGT